MSDTTPPDNPLDRPVPDAPGYYFATDARGRARVYNANTRRLLARTPVLGKDGPRWKSTVRLPDGRTRVVFPDEAHLPPDPSIPVPELRARGALPLPEPFGSQGFVMLPDATIHRTIPARRGLACRGPRQLTVFDVRGMPCVTLPIPSDPASRKPHRQTIRSVRRLFHTVFPGVPFPGDGDGDGGEQSP